MKLIKCITLGLNVQHCRCPSQDHQPVGQNPLWVSADTYELLFPMVHSAQECQGGPLDSVTSSPDVRRMQRLTSALELLANGTPRSCMQSCPTLAAPWTILRLFCPWDFPGENPGVCSHFLLQGIFPTLQSNSRLLHWQVDPLPPSQQGSLTPRWGTAESGRCEYLIDAA